MEHFKILKFALFGPLVRQWARRSRLEAIPSQNRTKQQTQRHNEGRPEHKASGLTPTPYFPGGAGGTGTVNVITSARRGLARGRRS